MTWTAEQVLALAVNAGARKSAQDLAKVKKWLSLETDGRAVWGEIKGSSPQPYQVRIDLNAPAFKCDCASRQQPCKYAVGLFLLFAEQPQAFAQAAPPPWVTSWIAARDATETRRANKESGVVDKAAQAKRAVAREGKVEAGLQELELWLCDLIRSGLASVQGKPYEFWDTPAARMVDAQAKGVANQLRDMPMVVVSGEGWIERLLERLSKLYLLTQAYRHLDSLPAPVQADVRSVIGFSQRAEEVAAAEPGIRDQWLIAATHTEVEDRLTTRRTWLWGVQRSQPALILDFWFGSAQPEMSYAAGRCMDAELAFFPSNFPQRAVVKQHYANVNTPSEIQGMTMAEAYRAYADALACHPWLALFPMLLEDVVPVLAHGRWSLRDVRDGQVMKLPAPYSAGWQLTALSGGHPIRVFGEWDGDLFNPLAAWTQKRLVNLAVEAAR